MATSYANSGGTGNRTALITVTVPKALGGGTANNLVDGAVGNSSSDSIFFPDGDSGWHIAFDFRPTGFKQIIDEITWKQQNINSHGTWKVEAWDGQIWTDLSTGITLGNATAQVIPFTNSNAYIIYRLTQTGGVTESNPWIQEVEFKIEQGTALSSASTDYSNAGGTGNRTASITVSTTATLSAGAISNIVNGTSVNDTTWNGSQTLREIKFDFGVGASRVIDALRWVQSTGSTHGLWIMSGSDDDSTYSDIGTVFTLGGAATSTYTNQENNVRGWRYYKLRQLSGSTVATPFLYEAEFEIGDPPGITGTLAATDGSDVVAFVGNANAFGPLSVTEAPDVLTFVGNLAASGTLIVVEASDVVEFISVAPATGTLAVTEASDSVFVAVELVDTLGVSEQPDVVAFTGLVVRRFYPVIIVTN